MKLLYSQAANVTLIFDTRLVNPKGIASRELFSLLKERYGFARSPQHEFDQSEKANLQFQGGVFRSSDDPINVALTVFKDGMVFESSTDTDDTMKFVEDIRAFVLGHGFVLPELASVNYGFASTLVVETEASLAVLNPATELICRFIETRVRTLDGNPRKYEFSGIDFWSEDVSKTFSPVAFKFERKFDQNFEDNRYFSQAPLTTKEHIELLDMLEGLLKA